MAVIIGNYLENKEKLLSAVSAKKEKIFQEIREVITNNFDFVTKTLSDMEDTLNYILSIPDHEMYCTLLEALVKKNYLIFQPSAGYSRIDKQGVWNCKNFVKISKHGFFISSQGSEISFEDYFKRKNAVKIHTWQCYLETLKEIIASLSEAKDIFFNIISECKYIQEF